jgi:multiple sugar transport system substrate-binding protein
MTIQLKGITWDHPRGYEPLLACSRQYAAATDVQVTWDRRSLKAFGDQPIDELTQSYDLVIIDHPHVGLTASTGCLLPLDEWLSADTLRTLATESAGPSHASYSYAGHQWGLAIDAALQTAVYRADLLNSPLPQSWPDVITLGEQARSQGRYVALPLVPTDAICSFLSLCASLGAPPGQSDDLVPAEAGLRALSLLRDMKAVAHPNSLDWNPIHMLDHMSSADDVVYCPLTFCYTNYSRQGYQPHLLTFTTVPGVRGAILGGTGFAVSSNCAHPQAACDYGAWLCSAAVQSGCYVEAGGQPGNVTAWRDVTANDLTNNFFANVLPTLEQSYVRPRHHGFITFQEAAGNIIHDFLRQDTDPARCLDELSALYRHNLR